MQSTHTIAIAAGGTGGHRQIALAIADAIQRDLPSARSILITSDINSDWQPEPGSDIETIKIPSSPFVRQSKLTQFRAVWQLGRGLLKLRKQLRQHRVDAVIGCGGYASASAVLAAASLRLPTLLHEANAVAGRANRVLAKFVRRICMTWPQAQQQLGPAIITGTPIRQSHFLASKSAPPTASNNTLLILGGSLGTAVLNQRAPDVVKKLIKLGTQPSVVHQCGEHDPTPIKAAYRELSIDAEVQCFLPDPIAAFQQSRATISAAGASTLAELAAYGVPCFLLPLPTASDDHQTANAKAFSAATGSPWRTAEQWDDADVAKTLAALFTDDELWITSQQRMQKVMSPDPGKAITNEIADLLKLT